MTMPGSSCVVSGLEFQGCRTMCHFGDSRAATCAFDTFKGKHVSRESNFSYQTMELQALERLLPFPPSTSTKERGGEMTCSSSRGSRNVVWLVFLEFLVFSFFRTALLYRSVSEILFGIDKTYGSHAQRTRKSK